MRRLVGGCVFVVCLLGCACRPSEPSTQRKPAVFERAFTPDAEPLALYMVEYNGKRRSLREISSLVYAAPDALVLVDFPDDEEVPDQFYLVSRVPDPQARQTARLISSSMLTALASARWHAADVAQQVDSKRTAVMIDVLREVQRMQALDAEEARRASKSARPKPEPSLVVDNSAGVYMPPVGINPSDISDIKNSLKNHKIVPAAPDGAAPK